MRIAALYDIHGNLPALEAVLAEVRAAAVDLVVIGGDVVPGAMPHESFDALRAVAGTGVQLEAIRGNGERTVLEARRGIDSPEVPPAFHEVMRWNAAQLSPDDVAWVESWPAMLEVVHRSLGRVLFCHATPESDTALFTARTAEARIAPAFAHVEAAVVVCGHTHMPFDRSIAGRRVVNAGSVGMPFGTTGADWLLIGERVEFRHVSYDLERAAARIRATGYPQREVFAAQHVLTVPSAEAMIAAFER